MLEAKDSELLAALRKTALLTEEVGQLRQQQLRQQSLPAPPHHHQQQQQQARYSSSSAFDATGAASSEGFGAPGVEEGSSTPGRQESSGLGAAAYCSQQLLTGYTASEPGERAATQQCILGYQLKVNAAMSRSAITTLSVQCSSQRQPHHC